jgi:CRP-like cAMP-binding protein
MIPTSLLKAYNAKLQNYSKGQLIFSELSAAKYYFQIEIGEVKMFNLTEEGKEFTQGFFKEPMPFGEPPLFGDFKYPASAICTKDSKIYILKKERFLSLIEEHPKLLMEFTASLCKRMHYKSKIMKEVSVYPPMHRILTLLSYLKDGTNVKGKFEVNLTRQQISELTGLRVETVIRAIKKLEKENKLSIIDRKIYL